MRVQTLSIACDLLREFCRRCRTTTAHSYISRAYTAPDATTCVNQTCAPVTRQIEHRYVLDINDVRRSLHAASARSLPRYSMYYRTLKQWRWAYPLYGRTMCYSECDSSLLGRIRERTAPRTPVCFWCLRPLNLSADSCCR